MEPAHGKEGGGGNDDNNDDDDDDDDVDDEKVEVAPVKQFAAFFR